MLKRNISRNLKLNFVLANFIQLKKYNSSFDSWNTTQLTTDSLFNIMFNKKQIILHEHITFLKAAIIYRSEVWWIHDRS